MAAGLNAGIADILYYNLGTYGTPTWTIVTSAIDVDLNLSKSKADVKSRLSRWKSTLPIIKEGPLEFGLLGDTSLAVWNYFRDAYINDLLVDMAVADGLIATPGTDYFRADFYVYEFPYAQKLEEANNARVVCDIGYSAHTPAWTDVV